VRSQRDDAPRERAVAGGADKWGHGWASYALTRGTTELLVAGGWRRVPSSLVAAGLVGAALTVQELKDGPIWGFEVGDLAADLAGAALAAVMEDLPAVDRLFDFRLRYFPSADFRKLAGAKFWSRGDGIDIAQDYSGMSYLGVGLDMQHVLVRLLKPGKLRTFGHGFFEVLSLPGTDVHLGDLRRSWTVDAMPAAR
jgi:hypothetical protein